MTNYPAWKPERFANLHNHCTVVDDQRVYDLELAIQRQLLDGNALRKTRPRWAVDYAGGMVRLALVRSNTLITLPLTWF
jgi:hypothetical protein